MATPARSDPPPPGDAVLRSDREKSRPGTLRAVEASESAPARRRFDPLAFAGLYRADVFVIAFLSHLIGVGFARAPVWRDAWIALLISAVSMNAIYVLNAWADRELDRVNKPGRPIPSGRIAPNTALRYGVVLTGLSAVYPFLLAPSPLLLALYLSFPVMGVTYSLPPVRLKRFPWVGVGMTSFGLTVPCQIGYVANGRDPAVLWFFPCIVLFCVGIVSLKDIEDVRGDLQGGIRNLAHRHGGRLLPISAVLCALSGGAILVLPIRPSVQLFSVICFSVSAFVFSRHRRGGPTERIYQVAIRVVVVELVVLALYLRL